MMKPAAFVVASLFATGCIAQQPDPPLVHAEYPTKKGPAKFEELGRTANTSRIKVTQDVSSSVGSSMFVMLAFYQVAKARHFAYFANLKEGPDKNGGYVYVAGFTNNKDADIKREFRTQFSYENEFGQKRDLSSVSEFASLFEGSSAKSKPAVPDRELYRAPGYTP